MKDILDQWEKEAKQWAAKLEAPGIYAPNCDRILALISALRVQEEALKFYAEDKSWEECPNGTRYDPSDPLSISEAEADGGEIAFEALAHAERILR